MKKTARIILSFVVMTVLSVITAMGAFAADNASIAYTYDSKTVTATATVSANGENKVLVVCTYKNGLLKEIKTDRKYINGTDTLSATVAKGVDEVVANVIDAFGGETASSAAVYAADSIEVRGIKVNGVDLEGFSNDIEEYTIPCNAGSAQIEVIVKDATTKVEITNNVSPGKANIELTSSRGRKKKFVINMYSDESQTYKLSNLTYKVGDTEYEIPDFSPDAKSYSVVLPDDTMSVRLFPETVGSYITYVTNDFVSEIDGVALGKIVDVASTAYPYKRIAVGDLIPVKSGVATAEIVVTNKEGTEESTYTINFTAKQPQLTEFNYVGAAEDPIKPTFVGGGAVYNDNGTLVAMDRGWALGNMSKSVLGGSCFMLCIQNSKTNDQWWYNNTSGEYFNFTADRGGTIVFMSANTFTNKSQFTEAGWTDISLQNAPTIPFEGINWRTIARDWNDYEEEYFMSNIQYNSANSTTVRTIDPGIAQSESRNSMTSQAMIYGMKRTFEAGENVSIYHTGRKDGNAIAMFIAIIWDDVLYAPDVETASTGDGEEELLPELPSLEIVKEDVVVEYDISSVTDTTSTEWRDESGKLNNLTVINDGVNGKWTENGYWLKTGSNKIKLPSVVKNAINTNLCSIQFELADVKINEDASYLGLMSAEENMFLYASSSDTRLFWATTTLQRPRVVTSRLTEGKHTITIDKNEKKIKWYIGSELVDTRSMNATDKTTAGLYLGTDDSAYAGEFVLKSFAVYNKVLTADDLAGGDAE